MHVDGAKLHIKGGRYSVEDEPDEYVFTPKRIDVDNVVIYGKNGSITLDAIRWLIKHNVQISILNWNGKLLTTMLPPEGVSVKTKFSQYRAFEDDNKRLSLAKKFIEAKFARTRDVLKWLHLKYPEVRTDFSIEEKRFKQAETIQDIMMVEGRVASFYFQELTKIVPDKYEFVARKHYNSPRGAGDIINCMLNYGYAILEAECMRAINSTGLDVHVGFLHEMGAGRNSLAYDIQEPFRFLIDLAVIDLIENNVMKKRDFIRTENYTLKLRPTGAKKMVDAINKQFNNRGEYQGKNCNWSYIILSKTRELSHYLSRKRRTISFMTPAPNLRRVDSQNLRQKILSIAYGEWTNLGYSKGTLHQLKKKAKSNKNFTLNKHVLERLTAIS